MHFQILAVLPLLFTTALSYRDSLHSRDLNDKKPSLHQRAAVAEAYADAYADAYDSAHAAIRARWLSEAKVHRRYPPSEEEVTVYEDNTATQPTEPEEHVGPEFEDLDANANYKPNPETETNRNPGK